VIQVGLLRGGSEEEEGGEDDSDPEEVGEGNTHGVGGWSDDDVGR